MNSIIVDLINERMNRIEEKVDRILSFKWQIVGASVALSAMLTIAVQIVAIIFTK